MKDLEQSHTEITYAQEELTTGKKALEEELANYNAFLLRIIIEDFNQGIRQVTFIHGDSIKDD